jgi:translation initiation factor IF-2
LGKIRVYELAKELGITSAELRAHLTEMGVEVLSASSSLEDATADAVRELIKQQAPAAPDADDEGLETVTLPPSATVRDFAQALDTEAENVIEELERLGQTFLPNQIITPDLAQQVARSWGYKIIIEKKEEKPPTPPPPTPGKKAPAEPAVETAPGATRIVVIERGRESEKERIAERRLRAAPPPRVPIAVLAEPEPEPEPEEEVAPLPAVIWRPQPPADAPLRPPVVTVMGHVDHGKTTLLDYIRKSKVTASEAGGITQHLGAYQVEVGGKKITFIDTPGHEAFTAIRARGAQVTDIAILVVGADDGVKPQTLEAIDHARAAEVPIIVAINKIDRAEANVDRVRRQLMSSELLAVELGGEVEMIPICALDGTGVDALLDTVLALADLKELKGDVDCPAAGTIIESSLDRRQGPMATVIVQEGTLRTGNALVAGLSCGKIRTMTDALGKPLREAGPSTPVKIIGLAPVPQAGDIFQVVKDEKIARQIAETRRLSDREVSMRLSARPSLKELYKQIQAGEVKDLNLIVKADTQGSLDAISKSLTALQHPEVKVQILHSAVGEISESDVLLAAASNGLIVGFHVGAEAAAKRSAKDEKVEVQLYEIIYNLIDDVRQALVGLLPVQLEEVVLGEALVKALFRSSRLGAVAGCLVTSGKMVRAAQARLRRNGNLVFTGVIESLRHVKDDVKEVTLGTECGIILRGFEDYQVGDIIEAFEIQEVRRQTL